ncbi:23009_t:CDS:2, partial [Racocetra persica]
MSGHEYFNRDSSEWNVLKFLNACNNIETFDKKIDCYLKSLETIANNEQEDTTRQKKAQHLLNRYRSAINKIFVDVRLLADSHWFPGAQRWMMMKDSESRGRRSFKPLLMFELTHTGFSGHRWLTRLPDGERADYKLAKEWEQEFKSKVSTNNDNTYLESTIRDNNEFSNPNDQNKENHEIQIRSKRTKKRISYIEPKTDDEEEEDEILLFEPSELLNIRNKVKETERISAGWEHKLLKWQRHNLKKLSNGIQHPSKKNIHSILSASSIFYFQKENEQAYKGFLTMDEISNIQKCITSKFEMIEIPDGVKEFVIENTKDYQHNSFEEIERYLKQHVGNQFKDKLLTRAFFRLLEEC